MRHLTSALAGSIAVVAASMPLAHAGNGFSLGVHIVEDYPGYGEDPEWEDDEQEPLSCSEGRRIVRNEGYRHVDAVRCEGDTYRYRAVRRGYVWAVRVDAWSGQIISERRIGYN